MWYEYYTEETHQTVVWQGRGKRAEGRGGKQWGSWFHFSWFQRSIWSPLERRAYIPEVKTHWLREFASHQSSLTALLDTCFMTQTCPVIMAYWTRGGYMMKTHFLPSRNLGSGLKLSSPLNASTGLKKGTSIPVWGPCPCKAEKPDLQRGWKVSSRCSGWGRGCLVC